MSINRTRWLDKLRPAAASSGGWTEGPMAPVETTDAATVDQRCPFKHRTGWRHNHSKSKLCVALRMGQANLLSITNGHLCAGAMLSSSNDSICSSHPWIGATRSIFQATRCACETAAWIHNLNSTQPLNPTLPLKNSFLSGEMSKSLSCCTSVVLPLLRAVNVFLHADLLFTSL